MFYYIQISFLEEDMNNLYTMFIFRDAPFANPRSLSRRTSYSKLLFFLFRRPHRSLLKLLYPMRLLLSNQWRPQGRLGPPSCRVSA